ncbi:MAG: hypothetical protein ACRDPM_04790 [Solirubrobacteraceae bacterium]
MVVGSELAHMTGYPFEVRYSDGALTRATAAADVAAAAYVYFSRLFSAVGPDIALIVADETDWASRHRLAAKVFETDGEDGLVRFWDCFHATDRLSSGSHGDVSCFAAESRGEPDPRPSSPRVAIGLETRDRPLGRDQRTRGLSGAV